jgi:hypothetical protein
VKTARVAEGGVALVTTVIVIAVLAVVAVALMQSTSTDRLSSRTVANYFKAQLAAEAGLAEALSRMRQAMPDFGYLTGAEPSGNSYRTYVRPLSAPNGSWEFNGDRVFLDSGVDGETAEIVLSGSDDSPAIEQKAAWQAIEPSDDAPESEMQRYAFWVDDAGGKQNLAWWGGGATRGFAVNLADLPLFLPDETGTSAEPFSAGAMTRLKSLRSTSLTSFSLGGIDFSSEVAAFNLPSVATFNLLDPPSLQGRVNRYFFTLSSAASAASPTGGVKLNVASLARHVDGLNTDQGSEGAKAKLVEELLKAEPQNSGAWGGGNLNWLAVCGKYSPAEQRQIVANLIDYLDEDLIPTTDSVANPTYFGVEAMVMNDGTVRGHPVINMIGLGSVFNWSGARETLGHLNSTRLLAFVGLVNPWQAPLQTDDYFFGADDLVVEVEGEVGGGKLGGDAPAYFLTTLNEQLSTRPQPTLAPRSGLTFPGAASGLNYANFNDLLNTKGRQPAEITFRDIIYKLTRLRLQFEDTSGRTGYVQIMPIGLSVDMEPKTVTSPGVGGPSVYKFTRPASARQKDLHLANDPRLNFKTDSWQNDESTGGTAPAVPAPKSGVDVTAKRGPDWDGAQGMPADASWYLNPKVTNHFNRGVQAGVTTKSAGMNSIGEFGYLWTGKPWQTLNLLDTDDPSKADWNVLDYISAGRLQGEASSASPLPVMPLRAAPGTGSRVTISNALVASGGLNINSRKKATLAAALQDATGLSPDAADLLLQASSGNQASPFGEIAALVDQNEDLVAAGAADGKFAKEAVQRALANISVNRSRVFTVYSVGEYRMGNSVSRAQLEADVFVGIDPATGAPKMQVINKIYR